MNLCLICLEEEQDVSGLCWDCYNKRACCLNCGRFILKEDLIDNKCDNCQKKEIEK